MTRAWGRGTGTGREGRRGRTPERPGSRRQLSRINFSINEVRRERGVTSFAGVPRGSLLARCSPPLANKLIHPCANILHRYYIHRYNIYICTYMCVYIYVYRRSYVCFSRRFPSFSFAVLCSLNDRALSFARRLGCSRFTHRCVRILHVPAV